MPTMPSQHGPGLWVMKETKRLARRSAEIVKAAIQPDGQPTQYEYRSQMDDTSAKAMDTTIMVPESLQKGVMMTKILANQHKKLIFRLDPDEGSILYKSTKHGIIPIEAIKEIRTGSDARYYRQQFKFPEEVEERWMTVVYILDGVYKTLHIIADTRDIFHLWDTSLRKIYAIRQGLLTGIGNAELRRTIWERQYWKGASEGSDHQLDFDSVQKLCLRLNANLTEKELREIFQGCDSKKTGYLDFPDFQKFVKILQHRPDLEAIYARLSSANGGKFDLAAFVKFLKESQKSSLSDDDLKVLFEKYTSSACASANEPPGIMTYDAFWNYLTSADNSAFSEQKSGVWQPMTRPISEYYISSSHNTYLVGNQLVGVSTIEGYIRALLHSCRSVELDIYDGENEPMVYHGNTLTSKVPLRDICQAIAKYAFVASPYPLIISAEVHCGLEQQDKIVDIMIEVFGESLIQAPVDGRPKIQALPSPEDLKLKFLLKTKDLYVAEHLAALQAAIAAKKEALPKPDGVAAAVASASESEKSENDAEYLLKEGISDIKEGISDIKKTWKKIRGKDKVASDEKHKPKMSVRLAALLVYTVGVKCHGIDSEIEYAPEHIFSLSENSANRFLKASMANLVKHNHTHLVRIYPKGTRVYSTNYEPHRYWAAGAQVAAINWQTFDLGYRINQAMFQRNGRAGYVLKPEALRNLEKGLLSKRTKHFLDVSIISAQQLPRFKVQDIVGKTGVDPYVEVSLHIPDWSHSPFLPESATAAGARYSPSTDATATGVSSARTISLRTNTIKNNGFNPMWQEGLSLPFDCIGDMKDLIFVEFIVRQAGKLGEFEEPLGVYCAPLTCLQQGFRHLPLHDAQLSQHLYSTLFVQIGIRDIN